MVNVQYVVYSEPQGKQACTLHSLEVDMKYMSNSFCIGNGRDGE